MKIIKFLILSVAISLASCSDFIDVDPNGMLTGDQITNPESFVNAAYSSLGNDHYNTPLSLWPYGNVRSDDAYKGGSGPADIQTFHFFETSSNIATDFGEIDGLWFLMYIAISRTNEALNALEQMNSQDFPQKEIRMGEMRFLRGHFYFMLKILFKNIPYIDETIAKDDYKNISNVALTNDELWGKIADDFRYAYEHLPKQQLEIGRADKYAAAAYLAKTMLYKAYRQDNKANNEVTSINSDDLKEVLKYTQEVIGSRYALEADFGYNFLPGNFENGKEALFSVQYSKDDGTKFGRLNFSDLLATPNGLGCCDFHKPSQNLVNAYHTQNGLPMFTNYDSKNFDKATDSADPRLFHTVAIPELPFKYREDIVYERNWNRNIDDYGVYASLKENVAPDCDCFVPMVPFYPNSKNRIVLRFSDVLLMRAEALIELKRETEALPLINEVRNRAKASTKLITYQNYPLHFDVTTYQPGVNCTWTYDYARQALRWERRLELAMEGSRFFDLVRWGITDQTINTYYQTEGVRRPIFNGAVFTKNKNEYIPIPQQQIRLSKGLYKQNCGF